MQNISYIPSFPVMRCKLLQTVKPEEQPPLAKILWVEPLESKACAPQDTCRANSNVPFMSLPNTIT